MRKESGEYFADVGKGAVNSAGDFDYLLKGSWNGIAKKMERSIFAGQ